MLVLSSLLLLLAMPAESGRVLQMYGKDFWFQVREPEGWTLETNSARQIANFIFRPVGKDWRRSESLIISRFVPRQRHDTLEGLLTQSREQFLEACPFADEETELGSLDEVAAFSVRVYHCPGVRKEVVAAAAYSSYFVIFALSSGGERGIASALPVFKEILSSFQWFDLPQDLDQATRKRQSRDRQPH